MSHTLLEQWQSLAYNEKADRGQLQRFWGSYFQIEKEIYEQLLENPDEEVKGTVKELAEKYGQEVLTMVGFLDGINESLKEPNPIETMDEDTQVSLAFDKEKLYKNMVAAKADWLYELPQWKEIYSEEELKKLYKEQKSPEPSARRRRSAETIPVPAVPERNIRNVVADSFRNSRRVVRRLLSADGDHPSQVELYLCQVLACAGGLFFPPCLFAGSAA